MEGESEKREGVKEIATRESARCEKKKVQLDAHLLVPGVFPSHEILSKKLLDLS